MIQSYDAILLTSGISQKSLLMYLNICISKLDCKTTPKPFPSAATAFEVAIRKYSTSIKSTVNRIWFAHKKTNISMVSFYATLLELRIIIQIDNDFTGVTSVYLYIGFIYNF